MRLIPNGRLIDDADDVVTSVWQPVQSNRRERVRSRGRWKLPHLKTALLFSPHACLAREGKRGNSDDHDRISTSARSNHRRGRTESDRACSLSIPTSIYVPSVATIVYWIGRKRKILGVPAQDAQVTMWTLSEWRRCGAPPPFTPQAQTCTC